MFVDSIHWKRFPRAASGGDPATYSDLASNQELLISFERKVLSSYARLFFVCN